MSATCKWLDIQDPNTSIKFSILLLNNSFTHNTVSWYKVFFETYLHSMEFGYWSFEATGTASIFWDLFLCSQARDHWSVSLAYFLPSTLDPLTYILSQRAFLLIAVVELQLVCSNKASFSSKFSFMLLSLCIHLNLPSDLVQPLSQSIYSIWAAARCNQVAFGRGSRIRLSNRSAAVLTVP